MAFEGAAAEGRAEDDSGFAVAPCSRSCDQRHKSDQQSFCGDCRAGELTECCDSSDSCWGSFRELHMRQGPVLTLRSSSLDFGGGKPPAALGACCSAGLSAPCPQQPQASVLPLHDGSLMQSSCKAWRPIEAAMVSATQVWTANMACKQEGAHPQGRGVCERGSLGYGLGRATAPLQPRRR